jgi:hypothetical protein
VPKKYKQDKRKSLVIMNKKYLALVNEGSYSPNLQNCINFRHQPDFWWELKTNEDFHKLSDAEKLTCFAKNEHLAKMDPSNTGKPGPKPVSVLIFLAGGKLDKTNPDKKREDTGPYCDAKYLPPVVMRVVRATGLSDISAGVHYTCRSPDSFVTSLVQRMYDEGKLEHFRLSDFQETLWRQRKVWKGDEGEPWKPHHLIPFVSKLWRESTSLLIRHPTLDENSEDVMRAQNFVQTYGWDQLERKKFDGSEEGGFNAVLKAIKDKGLSLHFEGPADAPAEALATGILKLCTPNGAREPTNSMRDCLLTVREMGWAGKLGAYEKPITEEEPEEKVQEKPEEKIDSDPKEGNGASNGTPQNKVSERVSASVYDIIVWSLFLGFHFCWCSLHSGCIFL